MSKIEGAKNAVVGKLAPMIVTRNTFDGAEFNLSSLKGKYVILDFWGTWCGPCMAGMPRMKELRDRYKDKLVLVGVAEETNIENWRNVIKEKDLNWFQIHNGIKKEDFVARSMVFTVQIHGRKKIMRQGLPGDFPCRHIISYRNM